MKNAVEQYIGKLKSSLPLPRKVQKQYAALVREQLNGYVSENPDSSYEDLVDCFGDPKDVAASQLDKTDTKELARKARGRRIAWIVIAVLAVALVLTAIHIIRVWYHTTPVEVTKEIIIDYRSSQ